MRFQVRNGLLKKWIGFIDPTSIMSSMHARISMLLIYTIGLVSACSYTKPQPDIDPAIVEEEIAQVKAPTPAQITFDSASYHFGAVQQGALVNRELVFTNTGEQPLEIQLMSACECTKLDWPVSPIAPGKSGKIKVRYDSKDKKGPQIVDIEIMANTVPELNYTKFYIMVFQ